MPKYVVSSESPINVREVNKPGMPDLPDWGSPEHPWVPGGEGIWGGGIGRPGHGLPPQLPPREEWPPLPPGLEGGLPIPPDWGMPSVPLPPEVDPPGIWPPIRPEWPDFSDKTLALALVFVSGHAAVWRWVVIDHAEAKAAWDKAKQAIRDKLPAGGVGGRPPQTKPPA